jgi:N-acylneuraminate cytidylyltransferase
MDIAVIPARGGSKRIPGKNIRQFAGRPMLAWSIDAARRSGLFDRIIVSTDDPRVADVALASGAEVPFVRPAKLADDHAGTAPVIAHAVAALGGARTVRAACCIYPCAPFLSADDLLLALRMLNDGNAAFVYPVCKYPHPVQRAMRRRPDGTLAFLQPEAELVRTQDLEETFHDAAQFYWGRAEAWLSGARMHSGAIGLPIPAWRVVDIDLPEDWTRAELLFRAARLAMGPEEAGHVP